MKWLTFLVATVIVCTSASAQNQNDSTPAKKTDTLRVGNMVIVKKADSKRVVKFTIGGNDDEHKKRSRLSTSWGGIDIGFSNYIDKTDYSNTGNYVVNRPGYPALNKSDFDLRTGKSININLWIFTQQLALTKDRHFNLKYGLGLELNNYRYRSSVTYKEGGPIPYTSPTAYSSGAFVFRDSISFKKNKLFTEYITVPLMLSINSNPYKSDRSFVLSFGGSVGYLVKTRNKQVSSERGKWKNRGDYDLEKFKLAYQAEIGYGQIHLYGSYSPNSMYQRGLDMRPYTIGLRFGGN